MIFYRKIKEENENLIRNYEHKFQELDQKIQISPSRIDNNIPNELFSLKLRACFSPTSNNILIIDKDDKKTLFRFLDIMKEIKLKSLFFFLI